MLKSLTCATFTKHLHTPFYVEVGTEHPVTLELIETQELHALPPYEAFSLVFRGPLDAFLAQASYRFNHGMFGSFEMFIVPIRQDMQSFYYEAVFNQLRVEEQA